MNWREFRFVNKDRTLIWKIGKTSSITYITEHGILGGKMQRHSDTPGSKGVEGTKSFVSAEDNLDFHINREIRKKEEHGYVQYIDGAPIKEQVTTLDWDKPFPKNFCCYKPQTDIKPKSLEKLCKKGLARFTRKYDGFACLAAHFSDGWRIYSRRMDLITGHFPKQVEALEKLTTLESGTLLVGEMLCLKGDNLDDFKSTSRVCRSKEKESLELRSSGEVPEPVFIIFDALFHNNKDLQNTTYDDRSSLWKSLPTIDNRNDALVLSVDYFDLTPDTWEDYAKSRGWEGFVVTDGSATPGDKFYNFSGKPKRPLGSHKLKPEWTEDCVVFAWSEGSGKRLGKAGSLWVKQINPETGQFENYGKVGSGLTEQDVEYFTDKVSELDLPVVKNDKQASSLNLEDCVNLVVEIKFSERQEGTNKFRFPVFLRERIDKKPEECIANI